MKNQLGHSKMWSRIGSHSICDVAIHFALAEVDAVREERTARPRYGAAAAPHDSVRTSRLF